MKEKTHYSIEHWLRKLEIYFSDGKKFNEWLNTPHNEFIHRRKILSPKEMIESGNERDVMDFIIKHIGRN